MQRLWRAFWFSIAGLRRAFADEAAFRQEVYLAIVLVPVAIIYAPDRGALLWLLSSVLLLMIVELLNTGIEAVVNKASPEWSDLAKKAKDTASAAVFLAIAYLVLVWGLIFWPA
jgi:diacylglycerol kinase (ATP)